MNKQRIMYITTPIYYASGKPHIGHAYTTILADVIARYKKMIGYDVCFLTGMDEHGQKIQDTAKKNNKSITPMLDEIATLFKQLWNKLDINYDIFVRTTDTKHEEAVQKVFSFLLQNQYIYLDHWTGYYCVSCEENYSVNEIIEKNGKFYCRIGHELTKRDEESYYLKIKQFTNWIKQTIINPNFILPITRTNELINSFVENGLDNLSISRTSFDWGIKVKENPNHVIYVWIDALMSYITGLGYLTNNDKLYKKYWANENTQVIHLMSKEITRFHCIYWPILLKMLNLRLPSHIISHGWVITKEGKMSKSLGNVIDPHYYIDKYGSDAFRYYIVKQLSLEKDGIFSNDLFINIYNSDLANNYGNMINRIIGMIKKYANGWVPNIDNSKLKDLDKQIINNKKYLLNNYITLINDFKFNELLNSIQNQYENLNKYIDEKKPWILAKNKQTNIELNNMLNIVFCCTVDLIILLKPILIKASILIEEKLGICLNIKNLDKNWNNFKINTCLEPIFIRLK